MNEIKPKWVVWLGLVLVFMGLASGVQSIHRVFSPVPADATLADSIASSLGGLWRPTGLILRYQVQADVVNVFIAGALASAGAFMLFRRPWSRFLAECCFWYWLTINVLLTLYFVGLAFDATVIHTLDTKYLNESGVTQYILRNLARLVMYTVFLLILRRRGVRHVFDAQRSTLVEA
jgi:hypothetical protein